MTMIQKLTVYTYTGKLEKTGTNRNAINLSEGKLKEQYEVVFSDNYFLDTLIRNVLRSRVIEDYLLDVAHFNLLVDSINELYNICTTTRILNYDYLLMFDKNDLKDIDFIRERLLYIRDDVIPSLNCGEYLSDETFFDAIPDGFVPDDIDNIIVLVGYSVL